MISCTQKKGMPKHVAIIMDGNNRWAKEKSLPSVAGHKAGVDAVKAVIETSIRQGVKVLTLFAFSSENWQRPEKEVNALMQLFMIALEREVKKLHKNGIALKIMGDVSAFSEKIQRLVREAEALTADNDVMILVIAANYGGKWDIVKAAKDVALLVRNGEMDVEDIDENVFNQYVCLSQYPAPDLVIRTAGEVRVSNFMLWQIAYSEMYFSSKYWPDFKEPQYMDALIEYQNRTRQFGKRGDSNQEDKGLSC
jgi:undecaprenyl diphosphate synthase